MINFLYKDSENLKKINDAFNNLDTEHSGYIKVKNLQELFPEFGDIQAGNSNLEYSDFLAWAIDIKQDLSKDKLVKAFKHFDPNNTGKITPDGLKQVLEK